MAAVPSYGRLPEQMVTLLEHSKNLHLVANDNFGAETFDKSYTQLNVSVNHNRNVNSCISSICSDSNTNTSDLKFDFSVDLCTSSASITNTHKYPKIPMIPNFLRWEFAQFPSILACRFMCSLLDHSVYSCIRENKILSL